jgi:hypothetical protein
MQVAKFVTNEPTQKSHYRYQRATYLRTNNVWLSCGEPPLTSTPNKAVRAVTFCLWKERGRLRTSVCGFLLAAFDLGRCRQALTGKRASCLPRLPNRS